MQQVLVATDFSTRSDRALRRGALLARQTAAKLMLVHVVDEDQPQRLIEAERQEATALLHDLTRTIREVDGINCESQVALDAFQGIARVADDVGADLIVLGPHRRQVVRDSFFGTTVERTVRTSRKPVLMANGIPAGPYRTVLISTDFSDCSATAAQAAKQLGLLTGTEIIALHVLDPLECGPVLQASMTVKEAEDRNSKAEARAGGQA